MVYNIPKKWLIKMYVQQRFPGEEIARIVGCRKQTIYNQLKKHNIFIRSFSENNSGIYNPAWKGGSFGYNHRQARKIMESYIGRNLKSNEVVHHIDRNIKNNKIDNLKLLNHGEHTRKHNIEDDNKVIPKIIYKKCQRCGKQFKTVQKNKARFCSRKCRYWGDDNYRKKENFRSWKNYYIRKQKA